MPFPLHPGDHWERKFSVTSRAKQEDGQSFPLEYKANAGSRVVAVATVTVGAGTFATYVIDRQIAWVKRNATDDNTSKPTKSSQGLEHPVRGYTRQLLWYAPKAGRVVRQAERSAGQWSYLQGNPDDFLDIAGTTTIRLIDISRPDKGRSSDDS